MSQKEEYKNGIFPRWADMLSQVMVIYSIVTLTLESEPSLADIPFFYYSELAVTAFFLAEYVARIWLAQDKKRYIFSFYGIVDFLATIPIILSFGLIDLRFARVMRLLRLLRLLKFLRYTESTGVFLDAFRLVKGEILVFAGFIAGIVYVASVGIYFFEHEAQPDKFGSITRSMWWAIVTITTVGYGDSFPVTAGGKLFTTIILFVGLGTVAIPSGLLASALTQVRQQRADDKRARHIADDDEDSSPPDVLDAS